MYVMKDDSSGNGYNQDSFLGEMTQWSSGHPYFYSSQGGTASCLSSRQHHRANRTLIQDRSAETGGMKGLTRACWKYSVCSPRPARPITPVAAPSNRHRSPRPCTAPSCD
ncbi:unnamed protein product [Pleuronectes platessa]|uniref:Uncharacterized protein n=1 Tax=Pleuronectes platessa TaxID=8262 RepID=A0A9N7U4U6_PLEPL|nr:unnamed protein product [Pleuronectes platessa]